MARTNRVTPGPRTSCGGFERVKEPRESDWSDRDGPHGVNLDVDEDVVVDVDGNAASLPFIARTSPKHLVGRLLASRHPDAGDQVHDHDHVHVHAGFRWGPACHVRRWAGVVLPPQQVREIRHSGRGFGMPCRPSQRDESRPVGRGLDPCFTPLEMCRILSAMHEKRYDRGIASRNSRRTVLVPRACVGSRRVPVLPADRVTPHTGPAGGSGSRGPPRRSE
jgi:hypothetical protein